MTWSRDLTSVGGFISPCENVSLASYYLQLDCAPIPQVTSNNKQTNIAASPEEPLLISVVSETGEGRPHGGQQSHRRYATALCHQRSVSARKEMTRNAENSGISA